MNVSSASDATALLPPLQVAVTTTAGRATAFEDQMRAKSAWQQVIDGKLLVWLRHPAQLQHDGRSAPTDSVLRLTLDIAEQLRDRGAAPPDFVTADPNGGIAFERRTGDLASVIYIWDTMDVEVQEFKGHRLRDRFPLRID